jgi:hypothetical protein
MSKPLSAPDYPALELGYVCTILRIDTGRREAACQAGFSHTPSSQYWESTQLKTGLDLPT